MFKIIFTIFDRFLFTLTFILGVQLPEFIQQYSQRLSGHVNEVHLQLNEFQLIANRYFNGNLTSMTEKYLANSEASINETADIIINTSDRAANLQAQLLNLQNADYVKRVYYFITEFDQSMLQATYEQYQLAIPLTLPAFITGVLFALFIVILNQILILFTKKTTKAIQHKISRKTI